ncbi:hypothetical protein BDY19DRAFT_953189 [Irpex rosettiformis]|uniref:Uncharacterized protein n=1 Tax=Irpex rosettiformis TaxID=378272 RepID=A0ACB8U0M6_9APHY|nr:hypothetical protein BDY19DRAFT_953189 [Irpex rosettiformis]
MHCNSGCPTLVEHWAQSDEHVKLLTTLQNLSFSGGSPSSKSGTKLVQAGVPLYSVYGSTECGSTSKAFDADDSQGFGNGKYELHYLNLTDTRGYATSDLVVPHPTKKGLRKIVGRLDDIICLSTAGKVVPISQESHLVSNKLIAGAVMFGAGKDFPGVLIEPHDGHSVNTSEELSLKSFVDKIWPIVEEANRLVEAHAYISREMIIVTDVARPLPRAAKGTVIRKQAIELYNDDIEKLYTLVINRALSHGRATSTLHTNILHKHNIHVKPGV